MTTSLLLLCFLGLQGAFIWARYMVFRIDGPKPPGVDRSKFVTAVRPNLSLRH